MAVQTTAPIELVYTALGVDGATPALPPSAQSLATGLRGARHGLAAQALAIGLWQLREVGAVRLEMRKGKSLGFIPKTELVVTPTGGGAAWSGVEGQLLAKLTQKGARDAGSLIGAWFGNGSAASPEHVVRNRMREAAIAAGLVRETTVDAKRGLVGRAILGDTKKADAVDESAFASAAPQLEAIAAGWLTFTQREPELARELVTRIQKALDRHEADTDNDGPDIDFD